MMRILALLAILMITSCSSLPESFRPKAPEKNKEWFFTKWTKNLDPIYDSGNLPIALNSPVIGFGMVYAADGMGNFSAWDLENGRLIWQKKDLGVHHAAPTFHKETIIYGTGEGRLLARDVYSGKKIYEVDVGSSIEAKPLVAQDRLLIHLRNHKVYCLDVVTGKILWAYKRSVPFLTTIQRVSRPLVKDNRVYVGFADGALVSLSLEEGMLQWERQIGTAIKFRDVDTTPVWHRGNIIAGSVTGPMVVVNPQNGQVLRRFEMAPSRAPFIRQGHIYVGTLSGDLVVMDANYEEIGRYPMAKKGLSSIVSYKGEMVVSSLDGHLFVFSPKKKKIIEQKFLGHAHSAVFGELVQKNDELAFISSRHRLYLMH